MTASCNSRRSQLTIALTKQKQSKALYLNRQVRQPQYSTTWHHHTVVVHCVDHTGISEEWFHGTQHSHLHTRHGTQTID